MFPAACHVHSNWSYDAKWSLTELANEFADRGYRILMMTDHDRGFSEARRLEHREACARASSDKILVVPGIEYADPQNVVHILVWGPVPFLGENLQTIDLLKGVQQANGIAVMAHPARRAAWKIFEPIWCDYLLGMEVWNRKADGWSPSVEAERLIRGTNLVPFVCLDFHAKNQMFPLSMAMHIEGAVTEDSVLNCLRSRACEAMAFSEPAQSVMNGWVRAALDPAERVRRTGASLYKQLKKQWKQ